MDLIEATMKALQGKLEEKPNKANAEINAKILEPNANKAELQKNGYNVSRANGFTSVKRADRVNDFREVSVFDDGTVMTVNDDTIIDEPVNKDVFDAKSFLDTDRKKPYEAPNKVSKFKMNKDTIAQADEEIADAEREKEDNPEDADILDKNVIEPWKKLKDKADAENKEMLNKKESRKTLGEHVIVENKECLKEETLTWEDIMDNAEGTTFGQQALKVKDTARDNVEKLLVKAGIDIDNVESVEDEIEKYCKDNNIKFDTHGNLLDKKTEAKYLPLDKKIFNRTDIQNYINKNNLKVKDEYDKDYKTNSAIATGYIKVYCTPEQQADLKSLINESKISNKVTEDIDTNLGEDFYEKMCRAYVDTANLEWVTTNPENNNSVVHGYFADDSTSAKWDYGAKVTPKNFKDVAYEGHTDEEIENGDVEWYDYDTWEDFYEEYVKDEIIYDMEDMGVYSDGTSDYMAGVNHWDFYISEEDLTKLGLWNKDEKVTESVVSDYTLSEIKRVLDSEETEYGYSLKITNSGADAETKTLDLDKSDLQAIYDALSKNKVTENKEQDRFQANLALSSKFGKDKGSKIIRELDTALEQNDKQKIKKLSNELKKELSPDDYTSFIQTYYPEYKEQDRFQANLSLHSKFGIDTASKLIQELDTALEQNDKQKIKKLANKLKQELSPNDYTSLIKTYYPEYKEVLESVFIESKKLQEVDSDDTFNKLQKDIKDLPDAKLDYKGICSLIAGYIEGVVGIEDNPEAMSKINIDLVREIADAVFNEDDVWEPMDDFIYSEIYAKLDIK